MALIQPRMKVGVTMQDLQGKQRKSNMWYKGAAWTPETWPATAIGDALTDVEGTAVPLFDALTSAGIKEVLASETRGFGGAVLTTDPAQSFQAASDKMELRLTRGDGGVSTPEIPAPKNAIVDVDGTVIIGSAPIVELIAALIQPGICDVAGNEYAALAGGTRKGSGPAERKPGGQ